MKQKRLGTASLRLNDSVTIKEIAIKAIAAIGIATIADAIEIATREDRIAIAALARVRTGIVETIDIAPLLLLTGEVVAAQAAVVVVVVVGIAEDLYLHQSLETALTRLAEDLHFLLYLLSIVEDGTHHHLIDPILEEGLVVVVEAQEATTTDVTIALLIQLQEEKEAHLHG